MHRLNMKMLPTRASGRFGNLRGQSVFAAAAAAAAVGSSRIMEPVVRVGILHFSRDRRLVATAQIAANVEVGAWAICSGLFICLYPRSIFFLTGVIVFGCRPWFTRHERWLRFPLLSLLVFLAAWHLTWGRHGRMAIACRWLETAAARALTRCRHLPCLQAT